jgi:hypothetical protein
MMITYPFPFAALSVLLLSSLFVFESAQAAISIIDGDFANADWTTYASGVNGGSASSATASTGGNPGAFREFNLSVPNAPAGQRAVASAVVLRNGFTYAPSIQGEGSEMSISFDLRSFGNNTGALGLGIAIRQDGETFISKGFSGHSNTWTTFIAEGLVAGDFERIDDADLINGLDEGSHPDLSIVGSTFEIGFFARNSTALGTTGYSRSYGYDNVAITIVPEPSVATTLMGLIALIYATRRRTVNRT